MKDVGLRLRVEKALRDEFVGTCRLQGTPAAEVLRTFMRDYILREGGGMQASLFQGGPSQRTSAPTAQRKKKWRKRS